MELDYLPSDKVYEDDHPKRAISTAGYSTGSTQA